MTHVVIRLQPAQLERVLLALENDSSDEALEIRDAIEEQKPAPEAPDYTNPPSLFPDCDSTDHDGAKVLATAEFEGRPVCGWHFEALTEGAGK